MPFQNFQAKGEVRPNFIKLLLMPFKTLTFFKKLGKENNMLLGIFRNILNF
jgi:hypothetical protein